MNQNGTHQASVFYLVADYTLGVGMFAAMPGLYTVGVHDRCDAVPIQFWLRGGSVRHIRPGTGMLHAEVSIPSEDALELRRQLGERGRCVYRGKVVFRQGDEIVAEAEHEMGMYVESPVDLDSTPDIIQTEKLKTSAIMISGLRDDPVSRTLAGEQGRAIASRMSRSSPQLPDLVCARSLHLEDYLAGEGRMHQQVVVLGAGLDAKPVRHASENQTWYLIDFDRMLRERSRVLDRHALASPFVRHVPADLRGDVWQERLKAAGYSSDVSTLFILEGVSMYLDQPDLDATISGVRNICGNAASRLWLDHVTERLLSMPRPEVRKFLATMARLGEPFINAFSRADNREGWDWTTVERRTAAHVLNVDGDPIFDEYVFSLVAPAEDARE